MIRSLRRFVFDAARLCRVHSGTHVRLVVIPRGGHHVEEVEAPKYRSFRWCHNGSFANCLGVDVKQNSDRVRQGRSGREPDQPGKSFLVFVLDRQRYSFKLLDVAEGLDYLHANHAIHGNLNGVGVFIGFIQAPPVTFD